MKTTLEQRVTEIEKRNRRVELDKAWENSASRRLVLFLVTFILTFGFLKLIDENYPLANAILAAFGFLLSTLTVSYLKNRWISRR